MFLKDENYICLVAIITTTAIVKKTQPMSFINITLLGHGDIVKFQESK